jgi:hypothetical protein
MTVTLELASEVRTRLATQAEARGMTLEAYAQQVLQERSAGPVTAKMTAAEKAEAFAAWARGHAATLPLSDEAISREHLVRDAQ